MQRYVGGYYFSLVREYSIKSWLPAFLNWPWQIDLGRLTLANFPSQSVAAQTTPKA